MGRRAKGFGAVTLSIIFFLIGVIAGFGVITYVKLPLTDSVTSSEEVYYYKDGALLESGSVELADADISIHFLELGNKYTGDCTYIKTKDADILIDCGSKTSSISTVSNYLNNYVTDGILEYVIVTHAHQDHYAGFATSTKIQSIFDLYECKNIIDFGNSSNQKDTATTYKNYLRERQDEIDAGAMHYTAIDCIENERVFTLDAEKNISFKVLNNEYNKYDRNDASTNAFKADTENDYSVCTLFTYGTHNYLFTGDLEEEGEHKLIANNALPRVDLYKAGHHGSKTSSSAELMRVIQPKTVCVCCCAGSSEYTKTNANQFPTQKFIDNVSIYTDKIYVTTLCVDYDKDLFESLNGNIVFLSKNDTYEIKCSNNDTILKETAWFKANRTWNGI